MDLPNRPPDPLPPVEAYLERESQHCTSCGISSRKARLWPHRADPSDIKCGPCVKKWIASMTKKRQARPFRPHEIEPQGPYR